MNNEDTSPSLRDELPHIGHLDADIDPYWPLEEPLLQSAHDLPLDSIAESVLREWHSRLSAHIRGLPLGRTDPFGISSSVCQTVFDSRFRDDGNAAIWTLATLDVCNVVLTLHSDGSALVWLETASAKAAPVPYAFRIALPSDPDIRGFLKMPNDTSYHTVREDDGLPAFWEKHIDPTAGMSEEDPDLAIDLKQALAHEAKAWAQRLPHIPQTMLNLEVEGENGGSVIYPWFGEFDSSSSEHTETISSALRDLKAFIEIREKLPLGSIQSIILYGRVLHRDGSLSNIDISFDLDPRLDEGVNEDIDRRWKPFVEKLFDHHDFPVPPAAQISQSLARVAKGTAPFLEPSFLCELHDEEPPGGHQALEALARIEAYALELPSSRSPGAAHTSG